ncbi:prolyl oligopeptidase family serine peptidase [Desulfocurvibacter africanus]|uniref:carboxylesterase family protein n=1 Tax=Desulfocurvibacter africanus TaxID=873 RepID=UPI0003FC72D5|nr:prolyl oligopeptidase family serine peptidase [Desulfocurvibacter africanus]
MAHSVRAFHPSGSRVTLQYLLHFPSGALEGGWPLAFFLHGAGERGDDPRLLLRQGLPRHAEAHAKDLPFLLVSPQCPEWSSWQQHLGHVEELLEAVMAEHPVDPDRIYLTGISMGGFGAWFLGTERPERFAAVVPICGYGPEALGFPERVCALRQVPVWAFHGAKDTVVPAEESCKLVDALRLCGGDVRLTIYPDVGHDSWTQTYDDPELYDWMLAQRKSRAVEGEPKQSRML